ncbi:hypothetical protein [Reinekea sp.]|uniref:hypothetical protein n=1 Tax=Reinekea sp. TaxID=1970455 RepID=UPI00398A497F
MGFSMVGGVMLLLVLIMYLKMIDARTAARNRKSQAQHWIEKAEVFESVADDANALKTIVAAKLVLPDEPALIKKENSIRSRLAMPNSKNNN